MEAITQMLQGSYAYLLILQVLVVAVLLLSAAWLVGRRARGAGEVAATETEDPIDAETPGTATELARLAEIVRALDQENARMKALVDENRILRDKAAYLESKLADGETPREASRALHALRIENEQLKAELGRLRRTATVPALAGADPVAPEVDPKLLTLLS